MRQLGSLPLKQISLGLLVRELMAPWTGHPYDFEVWTRLGFYMQNLGNPYRTLPYVSGLSFAPNPNVGSISYPPLSAFIFAATYRLYFVLGEPSRFLYYFLLKQPMVLADIGIAVVLAKILLLSGNASMADRVLLVWLYLPFGIIISSIWGALDSFALFLTLLAVYFFLSEKWLPSAAMLGLSIYLKTLPVIFLPVFLMQKQLASKNKLLYSIFTISIPVLGTLLPLLAFGWGTQGIYNNFSFQASLPLIGTMSVLGQLYLIPSLPSIVVRIVDSLWIPVLALTYVYCHRTRSALVQGLVTTILAFSISRSFLSEQWALYPIALLLVVGNNYGVGRPLGLTVISTVFLIVNNSLLVKFFAPISSQAFYWDAFFRDQSSFAGLRIAILAMLATLYLAESLSVILQKRSVIQRALLLVLSMRQLWSRVTLPRSVS